jgi:alpha-L-arabinofuranosidase
MYMHEMTNIRACTKWHLFDGNYGNVEETKRYLVLKPYMPSKRGFAYWLYYYLNRYIGDRLHPVSGTAPIVTLQDALNQNQTALKTPVMVTSTGDRIYIWLLNCDWSNTVSASITINGRTISSASGVMFKRDDPDEQGWTDEDPSALVSTVSASVSNNTVSLTLQPHTLTLLEVS